MICVHCGKEFESSRSRAKYCTPICGSRYRSQKYYRLHPELHKNKRLMANSNVAKRILTRVKSRCKADGIPFDLTIEDIVIPEFCPVLNIPLATAPGHGRNPIASPSLDRIRPDGGYVKGNVRVISNRANLLKSNATVEELKLVVKDLEELYE